MQKLRLLDLFSGIGGFSLGLERTGGFTTVAFCEIEEYPRRVLAKHWPKVPIYGDIRDLTADTLSRDGIAVDAICGGFPCQDISVAGKGVGLAGERSGLWREYSRIIGELRPKIVIVENVSALLGRGLDRVLGDLAALGYDAEWHCIPASALGAPHRRDRLWIVAYPGGQQYQGYSLENWRPLAAQFFASYADDSGRRIILQSEQELGSGESPYIGGNGETWVMAYAAGSGCENHQGCSASQEFERDRAADGHGWLDGGDHDWSAEPAICRVADGVPFRVDRLRSLGNAVVPPIPEMIGRAIIAAMESAE